MFFIFNENGFHFHSFNISTRSNNGIRVMVSLPYWNWATSFVSFLSHPFSEIGLETLIYPYYIFLSLQQWFFPHTDIFSTICKCEVSLPNPIILELHRYYNFCIVYYYKFWNQNIINKCISFKVRGENEATHHGRVTEGPKAPFMEKISDFIHEDNMIMIHLLKNICSRKKHW